LVDGSWFQRAGTEADTGEEGKPASSLASELSLSTVAKRFCDKPHTLCWEQPLAELSRKAAAPVFWFSTTHVQSICLQFAWLTRLGVQRSSCMRQFSRMRLTHKPAAHKGQLKAQSLRTRLR